MKTTIAALGSLALMIGTLGACEQAAPTGMIVEISSDLRAESQIDRVEVNVWNAAGRLVHEIPIDLRGPGAQDRLPARFGLRPEDPSAGPITIAASAWLGSHLVVSRRAVVAFRKHRVVVLRLALLAECAAIRCAAGQTCVAGPRCAPEDEEDGSLPMDGADGGLPPDADARRDAPRADVGVSDGPDSSIPYEIAPDAATPDAGAPDASAPDAESHDSAAADSGSDVKAPEATPADSSVPDLSTADGPAPRPDADTPRSIGQACTAPSECASTFCVDGVCCTGSCDDLCQACRQNKTGQSDGECYPVKAGEDPDAECSLEPAATCGRDGTCDGAGGCRRYGMDTPCGAAACSDGTYTPAAVCTGQGSCGLSSPMSCGSYACSAAGCASSCQGDEHCASMHYCTGNACLPKKTVGQPCSAARECLSDVCLAAICG